MRLTEAQLVELTRNRQSGKSTAANTISRSSLRVLPFPDDAFIPRPTPHSKALHYLLKRPKEYQAQQEHWHQCYLFHYFEMHHPDIYENLYATPNAGARGKIERGRLLSAGLKAGFPDVSLDLPKGGFHGLRCELKRPDKGAVLSDKQSEWIIRLNAQGYRAFVAYGSEEAIREIKAYCNLI